MASVSYYPHRREHGQVVQQLIQAPVRLNAVADFDEISRRRRTAPEKRIFPFMDLGDVPTESQFTAHNGNIAFVMRDMTKRIPYGRTNGLGAGTGMSIDVRVPVNTTLNGCALEVDVTMLREHITYFDLLDMEVENPEDVWVEIVSQDAADADRVGTFIEQYKTELQRLLLERKIIPMGIVTEQNRNNGESMFGVQHGGSITYTNNSTHAHHIGDLLVARVPHPDKMLDYPSSSVEADRIERGGRVELIFERYDERGLEQRLMNIPKIMDKIRGYREDVNKRAYLNQYLTRNIVRYRNEQMRLIVGRVLVPAASGADGVLHVGSYMI